MTSDILPGVLDQHPDLDAEKVDSLWNLIYSHVFHGLTSEAARLLPYVKSGQGSSSSTVLNRELTLMTELLSKKPAYNPSNGSVTEFEALWTAWRDECQHRLDQRAFFGHEQLTFICKVMLE